MGRYTMRYVIFECGPRRPKPGFVVKVFLQVLSAIIPQANPDFEVAYEATVRWWLEIDEHNVVNREIAFDRSGTPIAAAPLGDNVGIFTDLDSAPEGVGREVPASMFENAWQEVEREWRRQTGEPDVS